MGLQNLSVIEAIQRLSHMTLRTNMCPRIKHADDINSAKYLEGDCIVYSPQGSRIRIKQ